MAASGFSGLIPYAINFSIVAGAFVYFGRKPLAKFVFQRHERLKDQIESATVAQKKAEDRFAEVMKSLENSEKEIAVLLKETEEDALAEAKIISEKAEIDSTKLKEDAEKILNYERASQLESMKQRVIFRALNQAEVTLRQDMNDDVHINMLKVAKSQLEANA